MEKKHTLTDKELENLICVGSIEVDKSYIENICSYCRVEPICYCGITGCNFLRNQIVKELKGLTSDQLIDLVFNNEKYDGRKRRQREQTR